MRNSDCTLPGFVVAIAIGLVVLVSLTANAAEPRGGSSKPQAVVLVVGRDLLERRLPAFMQFEPGRFIRGDIVQRACDSPSVKVDSLLLFLPDSATCAQVHLQDRIALGAHLQQLTGRRQMNGSLLRQVDQPFVAIAPVNDSSDQIGAGCSCNLAPTGLAMCDAQVRTAGTPIAPVQFLATDTDSGSLTGTFTYQRDANPQQPGLPPTITSSCTPGYGTLQCTIAGTAPAPAGILQLMLTVSDGNSSLPLSTLLGVLAPVDSQIFANGFDQTDCL